MYFFLEEKLEYILQKLDDPKLKVKIKEAREMTQWLRTLTAFAEDLCSVPSTANNCL